MSLARSSDRTSDFPLDQVCLTLVVSSHVDDRSDLISARSQSTPRPRAVIIGSGFGGLAAAIRLGARGYRVTVRRKARRAGRTGLCPSPGRLHLRRGADDRHRAVPVRGAVGALRPADGRRRRAARDDAVLPNPFSGRRRLQRKRRRGGDARRDRAVQSRRCRGIRPVHAPQRSDLPHRLRAARRRAVQFDPRHGADRRQISPGSRASAASMGSCPNIFATSGCGRFSASIRC